MIPNIEVFTYQVDFKLRSSLKRDGAAPSLSIFLLPFNIKATIRKYLEDFVLKTGRQPKGKHEIPGVGKIDLDDMDHLIG